MSPFQWRRQLVFNFTCSLKPTLQFPKSIQSIWTMLCLCVCECVCDFLTKPHYLWLLSRNSLPLPTFKHLLTLTQVVLIQTRPVLDRKSCSGNNTVNILPKPCNNMPCTQRPTSFVSPATRLTCQDFMVYTSSLNRRAPGLIWWL